ncbi:MAG: tRNA uridine-5-carboxymethylaminomethyl(34) synthesis GTPase MnmE [Synergistaceae bacterium]|jgi:tRNA modification GTPase|nr:tRNA uridine-5-carboxymethylaminomethyl(34) synthesis GTPase MnmE [Synergistaceae bacterium]
MNDIIAAVATAWGESAISIVRLSGVGSVALVDKFFTSAAGTGRLLEEPARRMTLGRIVFDGETIDEVLAVRFEERASYTGEESAEIHCHGGMLAARRALEIALAAGARMALPGEFTKRAFLSGRIDLTQAEAVCGIIRAASDAALLSACRSLNGGLSERARGLMDALTSLRAQIEAKLDYPDEVDERDASEISGEMASVRSSAADLLRRCRAGLVLNSGVNVAILGRPNVGKSSLLNSLLGENRAIVTDVPGTTRDTVDASIEHGGLRVRFVDTAGIRKTSDALEAAGIERAIGAMREADIRVLVVDSSAGISNDDRDIALSLGDGRSMLAINKSDLPSRLSVGDIEELGPFAETVEISALTGAGLDRLKDSILELSLGDSIPAEGYAATSRMIEALSGVVSCLDDAFSALRESAGIDVTCALLADAAALVAAILGIDATEDLLETIFSDFCVGK